MFKNVFISLLDSIFRSPIPMVCSAAIALTACGGNSISDPSAAPNLAMVRLDIEPGGAQCTTGGTSVNAGLDADGNGILQASETTSTQYVCNGAVGALGLAGHTTLVLTVAEPAGANCANGGVHINAGKDLNGNGMLDAAEIATASYVCQGSTGSAGSTGPTGAVGMKSLIAVVAEPAGSNCTSAGHKVTSGTDSNTNGILDPAEVVSTNYLCDGAPGPGVQWQTVTAAAVPMLSNIGYVANSSSLVTLSLPAAPSIGDIVRVSGKGSGGWRIAQAAGQQIADALLPPVLNLTPNGPNAQWTSIASSADGSKLVAGGAGNFLYTSTDFGATWTQRNVSRQWTSVASSSDGSKLVASVNGDFLYTSIDSGVTWTPRDSSRQWGSVASSADGTKLVASTRYSGSDFIYTSSNSGITWAPVQAPVAPANNWNTVASSSDGTHLAAIDGNQTVFMSSDSGVSWHGVNNPFNYARAVVLSAGGTIVDIVGQGVVRSTDGGVTWRAPKNGTFLFGLAVSADGTVLVGSASQQGVLMSIDSGVNWAVVATFGNWTNAAISSDGTKVAVANNAGPSQQIYTGSPVRAGSTAGALGSLSGTQNQAVELQYLGGGNFIVLSQTGSVVLQ